LNRLGLGATRECDGQTDVQTDGWTDILIANAALNCVVRPMSKLKFKKMLLNFV